MSEIKAINNLAGQLSATGYLEGTVSGISVSEDYLGEYEVYPSATEEQELVTANKVLKDNIVVHKINYIETSNTSDGITVYIA